MAAIKSYKLKENPRRFQFPQFKYQLTMKWNLQADITEAYNLLTSKASSFI